MNDSNSDGDREIALSAAAKSEIWKAMWSTFVVPVVVVVIIVFFLGFFAKDIFGLEVGGDPVQQEVSHLSEKNQKVAEAVTVAEKMIAEVSELKGEAQRISADLKSSEVMGQVRQELAVKLKNDQEFVEQVSSSLDSGLEDLQKSLTVQNAFFDAKSGPYVDKTQGIVDKRALKFAKKMDGTVLRIAYADTLRVKGMAKACRWEILLDGKPCPSGSLVHDLYSGANLVQVNNSGFSGYCDAVSSGEHTISVAGGPLPGKSIYKDSVCSTGANESNWSIEVLELNKSIP